ncbi:PRTRC system ParB family protein [Sinimarinibacterium sp. CAU 1509]|uniref:PRTRC system ParB family protein n=1 Tax=Sinimarinibacterium sp. CAU 1509 TaxID=2562283 RepID=UPI00146A36E7|nr:PRTRC system ParB family protein [Sinimarinibacterium sp. CAU 1509]
MLLPATEPPGPGILADLAISEISVKEGHNPRRYFDPAKLDELKASIQAQGVVQPILVRPRPDGGHWIVAGERRFQCAKQLGLLNIPALIRELTDREAMAAAVAENAKRVDITPAEEAKTARQALDLHDGDEDQAARSLGWSRSTFRARLLLLNASEVVLDALMRGAILLGHAELLSTLPDELQGTVLERVLTYNISVAELKRQLASFTQELAAAPFDTRQCAGCPHNSSTQASLFEQHVGEGRCSGKSCWDSKVEVHLEGLKAEKATEFNVVWFDREKDPDSYVRLVCSGHGAVGPSQFDACKSCAFNGALIATVPGKAGRVADDVCFNVECNREKVASFAASLASPVEASGSQDSSPKAAAQPQAKAQPAKQKNTKAKTSVAAAPKKNLQADLALIRSVACDTVLADPQLRLASEVYALARAVKLDREAFGLPKMGEFGLTPFLTRSVAELENNKTALLRLLFDAKTDGPERFTPDDEPTRLRVRDSAAILQLRGISLDGRFVLDQAYLETLTSAGIQGLLQEAGFVESCEGGTPEEREKSYRKLLGMRRTDLIQAVLKSSHDFTSFVPASVYAACETALRGVSLPGQVASSTTTEESSDAQ